MRIEEAVTFDYTAQLNKPPYKWTVFAIKEDGSKLTVRRRQGSWTDGFFLAQDLRKAGRIHGLLRCAKEFPCLSRTILEVCLSSFRFN
jgi:hypothetical protein